jgi:MULE transposase domain
VPEVVCIDIHLADSSGIQPKEAHELYSRQVGGIRGIGYTEVDHNNCLRDMRKQAMEYGAAVAMTKYFARRALENPSFKHFEDTTENQEIANIVWTDAKMIVAYARFGDVVIFDTTFGTNNEKWAFDVFVGFNHFREIVIFDAALMYDQIKESFEWVFTKFLEAHDGKKPITLFTKVYCIY